MVIFNELFITFRTLQGAMNLGMSFCALCFGKAKFLVDKYTKSFVLYSTPVYDIYWNSAFALICILELCHAHLVDSIQLAVQTA